MGTQEENRPDRWVTVKDAAKELCQKPTTIRSWVRSGKLPGRLVGHKILIAHSDIIALIENSPKVSASQKPADPSNN